MRRRCQQAHVQNHLHGLSHDTLEAASLAAVRFHGTQSRQHKWKPLFIDYAFMEAGLRIFIKDFHGIPPSLLAKHFAHCLASSVLV
jgi:hypothetical protein